MTILAQPLLFLLLLLLPVMPTKGDFRRLRAELEEREAEEKAKRQAAKADLGRSKEELREEKRKREDERDELLEVVRALMGGVEEGKRRWEAWEKKAKWGWHGEGKYGWRQEDSSSSSISNKG